MFQEVASEFVNNALTSLVYIGIQFLIFQILYAFY